MSGNSTLNRFIAATLAFAFACWASEIGRPLRRSALRFAFALFASERNGTGITAPRDITSAWRRGFSSIQHGIHRRSVW